jgi:hypothetical protein
MITQKFLADFNPQPGSQSYRRTMYVILILISILNPLSDGKQILNRLMCSTGTYSFFHPKNVCRIEPSEF